MLQRTSTRVLHCTDPEQLAQRLESRGWRRARWKRGVEHSRLIRDGGAVISITSASSVVAIDRDDQAVLERAERGLL